MDMFRKTRNPNINGVRQMNGFTEFLTTTAKTPLLVYAVLQVKMAQENPHCLMSCSEL